MTLSTFTTEELMAEVSRRRSSTVRDRAIAAITAAFGVEACDLLGRSRYRRHDEARHALAFLLRSSGMSLHATAHAIDRVDVGTIVHSLKRHQECQEAHADYAARYEAARLEFELSTKRP